MGKVGVRSWEEKTMVSGRKNKIRTNNRGKEHLQKTKARTMANVETGLKNGWVEWGGGKVGGGCKKKGSGRAHEEAQQTWGGRQKAGGPSFTRGRRSRPTWGAQPKPAGVSAEQRRGTWKRPKEPAPETFRARGLRRFKNQRGCGGRQTEQKKEKKRKQDTVLRERGVRAGN